MQALLPYFTPSQQQPTSKGPLGIFWNGDFPLITRNSLFHIGDRVKP